MIFYAGCQETVERQLACKHDWHGPCIDDLTRFYTCKLCGAFDRDVKSQKEHDETVREREEYHREEMETLRDDGRRLRKIVDIIETVDSRCLATGGDLIVAQKEMTNEEMASIYKLASERSTT